MYVISKVKMQYALLSVLLAFSVSGCVYYPPHHDADVHHHYHPHDYYFYPHLGVYFHFSSGFYYYHHHGKWYRARVLPPHIRLHPHDRVRLRIDADKPYHKYREHFDKHAPKLRQDRILDRRIDRMERDSNRQRFHDYQRRHIEPGRKR